MARGYMGELLNVDLSEGTVEVEQLDEKLGHDYIGGYGLGAKLLYDRMTAGIDALGHQAILGFLTGPLTGTPALIGSRFVVFGKSPKTHTWGDANCGGYFGEALKKAGYDGILFNGISPKPVYLYVDEGKYVLLDASDLWGMNVSDLEDTLLERHGKDVQIASIGPAGEKLSLMAAIMNDRERAAGRSGLGAVMGSKRLKAIVVRGEKMIPIYDTKKINVLRRDYIRQKTGAYEGLHKYGTSGDTAFFALVGDAPVKNWGGVAQVDFPEEKVKKISDDAVISVDGYKRYACSTCIIGCGGKMRQKTGKYALELNNYVGHKPEYETLGMLGINLLNDNLPSLIYLNELINAAGLDTISVGGVLGYVIECFEAGLLTKDDLDGLEMTWGNEDNIVEMSRKIAKREGVGDKLADGVWKAWERFGEIGTEYAVHVQGEELPAHSPLFNPGLGVTYFLTPTPGRHTQGGELLKPPGLELDDVDKYNYSGQANNHYKLVTSLEVSQAAGLCMLGYLSFPYQALRDQLNAVTGWNYDDESILQTGERIFTMRHLFNLREGHNPLTRNVPGRMIGNPPHTEGNVKNVTIDLKLMVNEFLGLMDWDLVTSIPSDKRLHQLGMDFAIKDKRSWTMKISDNLSQ